MVADAELGSRLLEAHVQWHVGQLGFDGAVVVAHAAYCTTLAKQVVMVNCQLYMRAYVPRVCTGTATDVAAHKVAAC